MVKEFLPSYHRQLPDRLDNRVSSLPVGEKQMLELALTFIKPPKLLLLDEPTSALDIYTSRKAIEIIK
jgi:iron complex transport system ATP-binding protein